MMLISFRFDEASYSDHPYTRKGQTLYLVFESALLLLFSSCFYCSCYTSVKKVVLGSFLQIIQICSHCSRRRTWESQPYIGKIPAGNILTSAAILYSRALPSKALQMFRILNLATISRQTFSRNQSRYLQAAIHHVWKQSQELLLRSLKEKKNPIVLAGDGRSDNPGHSAKYTVHIPSLNRLVTR